MTDTLEATARAVLRESTVPFYIERADPARAETGDGLTLEGYAAVFNRSAHIEDFDGVYDEVVMPGAFTRTLNAKTPVLMFNHGRHPLLGPMPIGSFEELREDPRGLYVRARLFDNWLIWPLRDAIREHAIDGMSFRFEVKREEWRGRGVSRTRELHEVAMPELGPVVFPAYEDAKVIVRSLDRYLDTGSWEPDYFASSADAADLAHERDGEPDDALEDATRGTSDGPGTATSSEPARTTDADPDFFHLAPTPENRQRVARLIEVRARGIGKAT